MARIAARLALATFADAREASESRWGTDGALEAAKDTIHNHLAIWATLACRAPRWSRTSSVECYQMLSRNPSWAGSRSVPSQSRSKENDSFDAAKAQGPEGEPAFCIQSDRRS